VPQEQQPNHGKNSNEPPALAHESSETDFRSQKAIATENEKARNSLS
jgi:hypothetical protein